MAILLRQSTASQEIPLGIFLDAEDGTTPLTGLTISNTDIKLWKNGATALANKNSGGATHMAGGMYYTVLDATDTNTLGSLMITVMASGSLLVKTECAVLPANVYDSMIANTDKLETDAVQWLGAAIGATNQAGVPVVDVARVAGAVQDIATQTTLASLNGKVPDTISLSNINSGTATQISNAALATASNLAALAAKVPDTLSLSNINSGTATQISNASLATAASLTTVGNNVSTILTAISAGGSLELVVQAIKAVTDNIPNGGALNDISAADVNAEVLDVMNVDTFAELSAVPGAATTITNMIRLLYTLSRNKIVTTDTTLTLRNDADNATIGQASVGVTEGVLTRGKLA